MKTEDADKDLTWFGKAYIHGDEPSLYFHSYGFLRFITKL